MKILALDSSGLVASVAVVEEEQLIAEFTINYKKTHSQTLLPILEELKRMIDLDLSTLDAIAVAEGPGSFTGLRIGAATAKGLGLALNLPIIGIPTMDGIAYNLYGSSKIVCPILDARRNQVYTGIYKFSYEDNVMEGTHGKREYQLKALRDQCAVSIEEIIENLNQLGEEVIFLGDGVPVFCDTLEKSMKVPFSFAPAHMNRQRAASVAALSTSYYKKDKIQNASQFKPEYLRLSQAERERLEQNVC